MVWLWFGYGLAMVVSIRCVCGSTDLQLLGVCRAPMLDFLGNAEADLCRAIDSGTLYRCRKCHLGLRLPSPDPIVLNHVYSSLPQDRWTAPLCVAQQLLISRLLRHTGPPIRILDVGAFDGGFLKALPERFEKFAIEPSAGGRKALEALGVPLVGEFLTKAPASLEHQFDVVTMFDVYEHLVDPFIGVQNLLSWLKPGGRMYLGTGNMDHWSWKFMHGRHWYLDRLQHVVVGSGQHFYSVASRFCLDVTIQCLPHQPGSGRVRMREMLTTVYFALRQHPAWGSFVSRILHRLHVFRAHSHRQELPYMQSLSDHILTTFRKKDEPR